MLELELGASGSFTTDSEDTSIGLEDEFGLDGHVYYHNARFSAREAILDAYAGRDGAYVSLKENKPGGAANRLELATRYVPFYRDGSTATATSSRPAVSRVTTTRSISGSARTRRRV